MTASIGLTLFELTNKKALWTIFEGGLHTITKFTKGILAFHPGISPMSTRIITLKENGSIDNDYTLKQFIDFGCEQQANLLHLKNGLFKAAPIVVNKTDNQFVLSKFSMKLETSK